MSAREDSRALRTRSAGPRAPGLYPPTDLAVQRALHRVRAALEEVLPAEPSFDPRGRRVPDRQAVDSGVGRLLDGWDENPDAYHRLASLTGVGELDSYHAMRVMVHCLAMGRRLGLDRDSLLSIARAALLHDVGTPAVDREGDPMSADCVHQMLCATDDAAALGEKDFPTICTHIIAVATRFDELTCSSEGPCLSPHHALMTLLDEESWLDRFVVSVLVEALSLLPVGTVVRLRDDSLGVGVTPNPADHPPRMRLVYSS